MKNGKQIPLQISKTYKTHFGTVNSKNMKDMYLPLSAWAEPKFDYDCWSCAIKDTKKSIKTFMSENLSREYFKEHSIVDFDLRSSGVAKNKRSFMKCEITMFVEKTIPIKDMSTLTMLSATTNSLLEKNFEDNPYFTFHPRKVQ